MTVTPPNRVQQHLAKRELARRKLFHFIKYRFAAENRQFSANWHHGLLCEIAEALYYRDLKRVIINIPPRFLKSETFSQSWQAWMLGKDPGPQSSMLSASYSANLAERDARKTREIIESDWYRVLFPGTTINPRKRTASDWETLQGAMRASAGVGGTLTGKGADHLLVDDPVKPEESNSDLIRENANEWFGETMRSRLNDPINGTICVIMQRLHELDMSGYLLKQMSQPGADQYEHVCIANEESKRKLYHFGTFFYEREPGELLHPARIDQTATDGLKAVMGPNYEGQYNQRPTKMEGDFFKLEWLEEHDMTSQDVLEQYVRTTYQFWDLAVTEKDSNKSDPDYSVCVTLGIDEYGRWWLIDVWRDRVDSGQLVDAMIALHRKYSPGQVFMEKGSLEKAIAPLLRLRQKDLNYFFAPQPLSHGNKDKEFRAQAIRGVMSAGLFCVPTRSAWLQDFKLELAAFPKGAHDDMIDALSYGGIKLGELRPGRNRELPSVQRAVKNKPIQITGDDLDRLVQDSMAANPDEYGDSGPSRRLHLFA